MSDKPYKKTKSGIGFATAASLFGQLATLYALPEKTHRDETVQRKIKAALPALKRAPEFELAIIAAILKETLAQIDLVLSPGVGTETGVESVQDTALTNRPGLSNTESNEANSAFMEKMRNESAAAMIKRIAAKDLLTLTDMQGALGLRRQSISAAVKSGRFFTLEAPSGEVYYPAFYADPELDRKSVEKVSKALGDIPGASKYQFFTNKSIALGSQTPLEALKKGRLADVLVTAAGFAER